MLINPELVRLALWRINDQAEKAAFVPVGGGGAGGMPPAGGALPMPGGMPPGPPPPMDPMASMGGMPPGAMPPDLMGGAMPPPDAAAGGMPPLPPPPMPNELGSNSAAGLTPDLIRQIVREELSGNGAAAPNGGAKGKSAKPDFNAMMTDIYQIKKLIVPIASSLGVPVSPDLLDGPNRDAATGLPSDQAAAGDKGTAATPDKAAPAPAAPKAAGDLTKPVGFEHPAGTNGFDTGMIGRAAAMARIFRHLHNRG